MKSRNLAIGGLALSITAVLVALATLTTAKAADAPQEVAEPVVSSSVAQVTTESTTTSSEAPVTVPVTTGVSQEPVTTTAPTTTQSSSPVVVEGLETPVVIVYGSPTWDTMTEETQPPAPDPGVIQTTVVTSP